MLSLDKLLADDSRDASMTRDEKLIAVAEVLLMAATKIREVLDTEAKLDNLSREIALAMQVDGIAHEVRALAAERVERQTAGGS